jgi:trk system potassium uptake protein
VHIVIMGCGRVGSTLARSLEKRGHTVAGKTVRGVGFDREVLLEAGIEQAEGFAAVSSGDNSNILAARVVREKYNVENVVARIYDPGRAEVYQRLGIPTVGTVHWTATTILRGLVPGDQSLDPGPLWRDPSGSLVLTEAPLPTTWVDRRIEQLETALPVRVAYLARGGQILLPRGDELLRAGDIVHVLAHERDIDQVRARLGSRESEGNGG